MFLQGETPLTLSEQEPELTKLLLDAGAHVNHSNKEVSLLL